IGERIKGPAQVRDTVNGAVLFTLYDSTLVSSGAPQGGWAAIGLHMPIPLEDYGTDTLRRGRKIMLEGKVVGEVLRDMYTSTSSSGQGGWAELTGYIPQDQIYPSTIIENVLIRYADRVPDRSLQAYQPFINSFQLEEHDAFAPFVTYFNHENWVDDPSPLLRIQLVFENNKLIGVVHSRPLSLPGTTDHKLERGLTASFFNDTPKETRDNFIRLFNAFITSAD
ncbi:MAG TPA: hypothetical protein VGE66_02660, partial [Chitinophagaceae bacterium]